MLNSPRQRRAMMRLLMAVGCALPMTNALFEHRAYAQGPTTQAFTYQGRLTEGGQPVTGFVDFRFRLYDMNALGTQIGPMLQLPNAYVQRGIVQVQLDFGLGTFLGQGRWVEIDVRNPATSGTWTTLSPRQAITPAPYALYALNATQGPTEIGRAHV